MTTFNAGAATDKGRVRSNNQDSQLVVDNQLFAVADGMGGHRGGEVASAVALESLQANLQEPSTPALLQSVALANTAVYERASAEADLRGMGTTLCAIALVRSDGEERVALVNVGDSRVYLLRGDSFTQLTHDHSLVESLVRQGRLTATEAESHPQRNILTRALGIDAKVEVDAWELPAVTADRYLLCSDGLFNEVDETTIAATLRQLTDPSQAATELVRLANDGGGRDNITCVVVDVVDGSGSPDTPPARTGTASEPDLAAYGAAEPTAPAPAPPPAPPAEPTNPTESADSTSTSVFGDDAPRPKSDTAKQSAIGVIGPEELAAAEPAAPEPARTRRVTWRLVLFLVALVGLIGVVLGVLWYAGRNTYFVGFNADDEVTIFRGQPGGFLIFDPTVEQTTEITRDDLRENPATQIDTDPDFSTLSGAEDFVASLCDQLTPEGAGAPCDESADESQQDGGVDLVPTPTTGKPGATTEQTKPPS